MSVSNTGRFRMGLAAGLHVALLLRQVERTLTPRAVFLSSLDPSVDLTQARPPCCPKMAAPPDVDEAARGHVRMLSQDLQQRHSVCQTQGSAGGERAATGAW